ncbi:uncharacterized protein PAN0_015d5169 [Moesziomyces antarcticus]|uniref:Uncharacterized protein n=2 Tax=Pseudozyma antarctica TaxID=84753 RepID=A0A081CJU8_PSEA2|nr:uncharacterized protein PAN0_015d5169 [Moesziomyces antarcticus]GAK66944.1 conserved hypothetical protein [Moesziomyces antarcticus]
MKALSLGGPAVVVAVEPRIPPSIGFLRFHRDHHFLSVLSLDSHAGLTRIMVDASMLASLLAVLVGVVILGFATFSLLRRPKRRSDGRNPQIYLHLLDSTLLLAILPLLVHDAISPGSKSIVQTAFAGTPSTFFATVALVLRQALVGVLAANAVLSRRMRRSQAVPLAAAAAVGVVGAATITSVQCEFSHPAGARVGCAHVPAVKGMVVAIQLLFTLAAAIIFAHTGTKISTKPVPQRTATVSSPPESRIQVQSFSQDSGAKEAETGQGVDLEYGGRIVSGILDDGGQDVGTAPTSGYGSAIASSANPYRSTLSFARAAGLDQSQPTSHTHVAEKQTYGWSDFAPRSTRRKAARAAADAEMGGGQVRDEPRWMRLLGSLCALAWPVALSSTALLITPSAKQTYLVVAGFCTPAVVIIIKSTRGWLRPRTREAEIEAEEATLEADSCSTHGSDSVVVVAPPSRVRHLRCYSYPLQAENGYAATHRSSLTSAKSVPYLRQHWAAGKVSGDRVAPRSSWVRALNLLVNPKPRLEVLPARQSVSEQPRKEERRVGGSSATFAAGRGLLQARETTADSEHTCISDRRAESVTTLDAIAGDETAYDHEAPQQEAEGLDDSPGSARRWGEQLDEQSDLRSPTKRVHEPAPTPTTSFSNEESQALGSGAARLFNEIMELVRGTDASEPRPVGAGVKRTPPRGYAALEDASRGTVIVHPESSYVTANASHLEGDEGRGHRRTGSASSGFSLSSISSRLRAMGGRDADSPVVRKMRSRTFASAFGIELGTLVRSASWGRRAGVESSPSTSAGTCQSSLLDVGHSPSPAAPQHRRMGSHADSLIEGDEAVEELDDVDIEERASSSAVSEWTRDMTGDLSDISLPLCELEEEGVSEAEIIESYKMVRLAAAPFLDTVEEESEAECEGAFSAGQMDQAEWQRVLLAQHEAMFPHKTLSQIDEVTEAATSPACSEAASARASRIEAGDAGQMHTPSAGKHTAYLGLRMSKAVHTGMESSQTERDEHGEGSMETPGLLPFVTPRSRMRCRAAESRAPHPEPTDSTVDIEPSPRCQNVRLEELGMHEGIWQRSPVKLELSAPAAESTQTTSEDAARGGTRLRRSMTLKWSAARDRHGSPKREVRNRLARQGEHEAEKRLLHKPLKKPRKSRLKGVAVMIARHQFTVVDEDDSLVQQRAEAGHD